MVRAVLVLCDNGPAFTGGPRARGGRGRQLRRAITKLRAQVIHSWPLPREKLPG